MEALAFFLLGVGLTVGAVAWRYGLAGPSPVSPEAITRLASAVNRVVIDVDKLEAKGVVDRADIDKLRGHVTEMQDRVGKLEWKKS